MCLECGCGQAGEVKIEGVASAKVDSPLMRSRGGEAAVSSSESGPEPAPPPHIGREHNHGHGPVHGHDAEHAPVHPHELGATSASRTLEVHEAILSRNDRLAERNRGFFKARGLLVLNLVSGPGSGKTTLIEKTAKAVTGRLRTGVIVGDLATDNDSARLRSAGVPVVQITTGTVCHLEAEMVARAMGRLDLTALDLLIIENVGNLVCPAVYDLGEDLRVVLLSTTEGEDKPLKYPPIFHSADVAILTKLDLAEPAEFKKEQALANLRRVSHHATLFELSARTGAGLDAWCEFLVGKHKQARAEARPL